MADKTFPVGQVPPALQQVLDQLKTNIPKDLDLEEEIPENLDSDLITSEYSFTVTRRARADSSEYVVVKMEGSIASVHHLIMDLSYIMETVIEQGTQS